VYGNVERAARLCWDEINVANRPT